MHWDDESSILRAKFPLVAERQPEFLQQVGNATKALRKAIDRDELYAEFSHRALCAVVGRAERVLRVEGTWKADSAKRCWRAWLCKLDQDNSDQARGLIDSNITGGAYDDDVDAGL